jgi:hypothetical protein
MTNTSKKYFDEVCTRCRKSQLRFSNPCTSNTCCVILKESLIPNLILDNITNEEKAEMLNDLKMYKKKYNQ